MKVTIELPKDDGEVYWTRALPEEVGGVVVSNKLYREMLLWEQVHKEELNVRAEIEKLMKEERAAIREELTRTVRRRVAVGVRNGIERAKAKAAAPKPKRTPRGGSQEGHIAVLDVGPRVLG